MEESRFERLKRNALVWAQETYRKGAGFLDAFLVYLGRLDAEYDDQFGMGALDVSDLCEHINKGYKEYWSDKARKDNPKVDTPTLIRSGAAVYCVGLDNRPPGRDVQA
jgi:hypothetical protein